MYLLSVSIDLPSLDTVYEKERYSYKIKHKNKLKNSDGNYLLGLEEVC